MAFKYIPELDFYFHKYWDSRGEITTYHVPDPAVEPDETKIPGDSFLRLLFSETFPDSDYVHLFKRKTIDSFHPSIRDRVGFTSSIITTWVSDSTAGTDNVFSIVDDDQTMLDKLLLYRKGSTPILTDVVYGNLSTILSQLIFLYLDLQINGNFDNINTDIPLSNDTLVLETLFEVYVVNETHRYIRNLNIMIDSVVIDLRPVRDTFTLTTTLLTDKKVTLSESPNSNSEFWVFYNGDIQKNANNFTIDTTSSVSILNWESSTISFKVDDVILVDYNVLVEV